MANVVLRNFDTMDRSYILDSFLKSYGRSYYARGTHPDVLIGLMDPLLVYWSVKVATDETGLMIIGWIVYRDDHTVAWMHVRQTFRGLGIGKQLLIAAGINPGSVDMAFMPHGWTLKQNATSPFIPRFKPYLPMDMVARAKAMMSGGGN